MSSTMPAKHLIVLKRIMLLPRRNSWQWYFLGISLGSILLILKLLFILTMLPLSILCRKRMPNQDSLGGYSFCKNLICRLSIEKEKTIRWRIIFQGWKIPHDPILVNDSFPDEQLAVVKVQFHS